jgi:hypothetical protein
MPEDKEQTVSGRMACRVRPRTPTSHAMEIPTIRTAPAARRWTCAPRMDYANPPATQTITNSGGTVARIQRGDRRTALITS